MSHSDLLYVQQVKSMGNRQTFHPAKLDYDVFNIEIEIGPTQLLLHGLFLKKLWWIKVKTRIELFFRFVDENYLESQINVSDFNRVRFDFEEKAMIRIFKRN